MNIDDVSIQEGSVYFVAEAGVNHNGDIEMAEELIEVAADAGADAVKFQTFSTDRLVSKDAEMADYQDEQVGADSQYEMLRDYELTEAEHRRLMDHASSHGITFLSTPFDIESVRMLADLNVPAIKIGSGELTNHPLLETVADLGLPMIVSTGMATMDEVRAARDAIRSVSTDPSLAFLHCTSDYPCSIEDVNLRAMTTMDEELPEPIGYSDHTTHPETAAFAVSAGAKIVEKHFTLDATLAGPDHEASSEPDELERAIALAKRAAMMRGRAEKGPVDAETEIRTTSRKSLHTTRTLEPGSELAEEDLKIVRPADGLSPGEYDSVRGRTVVNRIDRDQPITSDDIAED